MLESVTVFDAKRLGVINCSQEDLLLHAAQSMVAEDVSALVVVDENGYLVGIITRSDILRARLEKKGWQEQFVKDYMVPEVITVTPQTSLIDTARIMIDHRIHRVVVTRTEDEKPIPISVVSSADIVYHMVKGEQNLID